jgi:isopentenyl-diphosphate delta-isomerase
MEQAVTRRLHEELNISLKPSFSHKFIYKVTFPNDLIEHEYDHVYIGTFDGEPQANKEEIEDWKYISKEELKNDIKKNPDKYSHWFKIILSHEIMEA